LLTLSDVTIGYGAAPPVLTGVQLRVGRGLWLLTGANGSGKSSLLRCAAGILRPRSGRVRFGGADAWAEPTAYRWQLGYAPQELLDLPETSGHGYLAYLAALKGIRPALQAERVSAVMALVRLPDGQIAAYSAGMRRRLALAAALLNDPDLLLLDEPTEGLDPAEVVHLRLLLGDLAADRTTLLATHLPEAFEGVATGRLHITAEGVIPLGD
jgi:ABC-type multidrug transport system ATPase subunit